MFWVQVPIKAKFYIIKANIDELMWDRERESIIDAQARLKTRG